MSARVSDYSVVCMRIDCLLCIIPLQHDNALLKCPDAESLMLKRGKTKSTVAKLDVATLHHPLRDMQSR